MYRSGTVVFLAAAVFVDALSAAAPSATSRPEIFSIRPNEGAAGAVVKIGGTGLGQTRDVLLCVGRTGRKAQFKVNSDSELEVTVPLYLSAGKTATVVVITPRGATVGMPVRTTVRYETHGRIGWKENTATRRTTRRLQTRRRNAWHAPTFQGPMG